MDYVMILVYSVFMVLSLLPSQCSSLHQMAPRRKPVFTTDPHDAFGLLKRSLLLRCHAEGEPPPLIIWYKDGQQVQSIRERPGTSNKIIKSGELMFLSFEPDDEGTYYCNASNSEGWTKSEYAHAQLAYLEPITEGPQSQVTSTGENVIMQCKIPQGLPTPVVNWYHNTEPVQTSQRINIIDGDLHISEVQRKDAGTYQCEVRNHAGRRESEAATLTIHQKPRFEITPSNQQVKVGEDVEFVCRVNGDPKPSILWRRENGQHIPEDRSVLRDDKSLRIFQVRREDAGTYVCQAKNEAGSIDASAKLVVLSPPSFTITPTDTTVAEGERAVFNCQAGGSPRPFIRWVHNGEYFLYPDFRTPHVPGTPRVFVDHEGSLVVTSARKSDEGKYECRASHKTGMVRSSANLFVSDSNPPPIIVIELGPQNQTVLLGTTATLRCETHLLGSVGLPERLQQDSYGVSVTWSKNGFNFTPDSDPRVVLLSQGTLQINDINFNDQGNYTCRAETTPVISQLHQKSQPMYTTEWTANLHVTRAPLHPAYQPSLVENLPRPPATVDIVDVGDSWISVKCTVSPLPVYGDVQSDQPLGEFGLPLPSAHVVERTRVQIEYVGIDGISGGWIVAAEARPDEMVKISGLQPESGYRILARTVSPRGVGRPHILPHTVYTKKRHRYVNFTNYPTDHINSVLFSTPQLTSLSTSEIEISGRICGAPNALTLLTGIRVRYRAVPLTRCLLPTESTTLLTDHCLNYAPSLYAEDMDDNLTSMTENYCSLAMLSDISVDHSRTQLPPSSELEHDRFMELSLVDSAPFRMVLDNLSPFVCYEVEVDAYSEDRTLGRVYSQSSRSANVLTFDSTPSQAPQDVKARWIGGEGEIENKVLEVVWSPPPSWSTNGLITGFSLRLLGRDLEQRKTFRVGPKVNQHRVENLQPNTNFTLYLAAITCHGEGVRSEPYPIIASNYIRLMGRNASDFFVFTRQPPVTSTLSLDGVPTFNFKPSDTTQYPIEGVHYPPVGVKVYNHTWFIASLVGVAVLWLLIFAIILVCRRKRRQRVKQRYPPTSTALGVGGGDDMAFRLKHSVDRNSKIGLLDSGKENGVLLQQNHHTQQNQQQSILAPVGLMKHSSPRLQMGTGILTAQRSAQQQPPPPMHHEEAGYEAPGGSEGMKLPSTGSIFLATGGTTSSSSQNSSLHKSPTVSGGVLETSGMETVNENHGPTIDPNPGGGDEGTLHEDDPNSVSPYASTSLIEQLRRGGERERGGANLSFSEVIPPPPRYPPPPVPSDSPPTQHNIYSPSECCHYAQSDLHQQKLMADEVNGGQMFMGAPQTVYLPASAAYPAPGQEQYWPPNGMCYVQQQSVVNPSMSGQNGTLYVPHMMGTLPNSSAPMFMTQQRSNQAPSGYYNPHHHQQMMLMLQHQQQPSSAIADDVVLPTSTLTHPPRNVQIHADK